MFWVPINCRQIYERSISRIQGLARLLVLEKLPNEESRVQYLNHRKALRGRPSDHRAAGHYGGGQRGGHKFQGNLKADVVFGGLEMNDYDVLSLRIPYGHGWDARRIEKLVFKTVSYALTTLLMTLANSSGNRTSA